MSSVIKLTISRIKSKVFFRINSIKRKKLVERFASKIGLVYFGFVDQNSDEHRIVRGLTVSSSHQDDHYSVGSVGGYGVTFVDRSDYVVQPNGKSELTNWLIIAIDLQTKQPIPHFFIGAHNHDQQPFEALFSTFPNMKELNMGTFEAYSAEFTSRFSVYARPAKAIEVERIITADSARILGTHFWPLSVEQHDNVLYVYAANENVTTSLLDTMLESGLWLAGHLDAQAEIE